MMESHLFPGSQSLGDPSELEYGVSITDACIGWDETAELMASAYDLLGESAAPEVAPVVAKAV